jgi:phage gpG-like protein
MITGYLVGDKALVAKLSALPGAIKGELDNTVKRLTEQVKATSQTNYLRGPRPTKLGVKTGRLITSIATRYEFTPTASYGYVGTNVSYGLFWERGFTKRVGGGSRGGLFWGMGPQALQTYFAKHPPGTKTYGARPFLKPALFDNRDNIVAEISATLHKVAENGLRP